MNARNNRAYVCDGIAGAALVILGLLALVVRLGVLHASTLPEVLLHWWPVSLIGLGVGLWLAQLAENDRYISRRVSGVNDGR